MPGGDRTGPMGAGPMTGRGFGFCAGANVPGYGVGFGRGRGFSRRRWFGRGFGPGFGWGLPTNWIPGKMDKELLQEQKNILQSQLEAIEKQLGDL